MSDNSGLACPACDMIFDLEAIFTNCLFALPEFQSLAFRCPRCEESSEVKIEDLDILIGGPDGFPEPTFREHARLRASDPITVSWDPSGAATVTLGDRRWSFRPPHYRWKA